MRNFVIDANPKLILRTKVPEPWLYFSKWEVPEGSPVWTFFGTLGDGIQPGKEVTIIIYSKYGPVVSTVYTQGIAKKYNRPHGIVIDELGVHPPNIEGVRGRTIAPGQIPPEEIEDGSYLDNSLKEAETWGWIDVTNHNEIKKILQNKKSFQNTLQNIRKQKQTIVFEPEVEALIRHLEKIEAKRQRNKKQ